MKARTVKFDLTHIELVRLRAICKVTKLSYYAMAARPKIARELIDKYQDYWGKAGQLNGETK